MTSTYWVEMTLNVPDQEVVDRLIAELDHAHKGQIAYTYAPMEGQLVLAMSTVSDEPIETIPGRVGGLVRATAHGLGYSTPNWPQPIKIDDVRIKVLATEAVHC